MSCCTWISGYLKTIGLKPAVFSFLIKLVRERQYLIPDFENVVIDEAMLASFDVGEIALENLLFQTGYLTIARVEDLGGERFYYLTYPNREVKASLNGYLLRDLTQTSASAVASNQIQLYKALSQADFVKLQQSSECFAAIPRIGTVNTNWLFTKVIMRQLFMIRALT